ncbi:MAG: hypothetical protein ACYC0V_02730 [Armatimonadota bacterium]
MRGRWGDGATRSLTFPRGGRWGAFDLDLQERIVILNEEKDPVIEVNSYWTRSFVSLRMTSLLLGCFDCLQPKFSLSDEKFVTSPTWPEGDS